LIHPRVYIYIYTHTHTNYSQCRNAGRAKEIQKNGRAVNADAKQIFLHVI
jgi:hypothetical protein